MMLLNRTRERKDLSANTRTHQHPHPGGGIWGKRGGGVKGLVATHFHVPLLRYSVLERLQANRQTVMGFTRWRKYCVRTGISGIILTAILDCN